MIVSQPSPVERRFVVKDSRKKAFDRASTHDAPDSDIAIELMDGVPANET